ncbi:MAG TPA: hypothetical protein VFT67_04035, partial [Jatrophihabitantaceae bacterium]|nr:hypothetical protein [Jatrophihabitantaceae bacterium]
MHVDVGSSLGGIVPGGNVAGAVGCTGAELTDVVGAVGDVAVVAGALADLVAGALFVAGGVAMSLPLVIICVVGIGSSGLF